MKKHKIINSMIKSHISLIEKKHGTIISTSDLARHVSDVLDLLNSSGIIAEYEFTQIKLIPNTARNEFSVIYTIPEKERLYSLNLCV